MRGAAASSVPSYAGAGVDIDAGDEAVRRIKGIVQGTSRPEVLGAIGGFGGLFAFDPAAYRRPVLVSSTDGVGTKAYVASALGRYSTIGVDLVAMCVDDIVCSGAEPLFLLDYLAVSRLDPSMVEEVVAGVADGCRQAGCALIGGEMAEHPPEPGVGEMHGGIHFDLAGFAVGVVEESRVLRAENVVEGDELVGIASPGLRCNGYSLARHALLSIGGRSLSEEAWPGAGRSLGDALLEPSVIYAPAVLTLMRDVEVHGVAHITGGGIVGNLPRVLPAELGAVVDGSSWPVPRIFSEVRVAGDVPVSEMVRVFNMGVGMVVAVPSGVGRKAAAILADVGHEAWVVGRVVGGGSVEVSGLQ